MSIDCSRNWNESGNVTPTRVPYPLLEPVLHPEEYVLTAVATIQTEGTSRVPARAARGLEKKEALVTLEKRGLPAGKHRYDSWFESPVHTRWVTVPRGICEVNSRVFDTFYWLEIRASGGLICLPLESHRIAGVCRPLGVEELFEYLPLSGPKML